jgi:magnesium chelatase subunit D
MHHIKRRTIPFTAIVGQDDMKFALILNAINPRIGGVLIRGDKGTAKSTAVRALADLLEDILVVEDCPFNCDPGNSGEMCDMCFERSQSGQIKEAKRRTPLIDLPLGATEDRVVGSLNVERAIKEGIKALEPGILAAANRGILYIDEVNLLDDHVADVRVGYCREIAETTGGKYYPISGLSPEAVYNIVDDEQKLLFETNT